ncbi:MAG: hypothetical protein QI223_01355 [Candidatus Korarchaeota archaeon]|nr:hypothetical protein [Candidatus Korarchaeota archaeon]
MLGWAERTEIVELNSETGEGVLRVWGSFEATEPAEKPSCHFLLGGTTEFMSEMVQKPLFELETRCQSVGDEYCEFVIKEKPFVLPE